MKVIRSWREQKVMLKWMFPELIDRDLDYNYPDEKEDILSSLSRKLKKTKQEISLLLQELRSF